MIKVYFIIESNKWIQFNKYIYYKKYIKSVNLIPIKINYFSFLWSIGFFRNKYIIFSSWRLAINLINKKKFKDHHFKNFMACVTSHSNLNDNLLNNKIKSKQQKKAINILSKFKVVTTNSKILFNFLKNYINDVRYCPNGVDLNLFNNKSKKIYNSKAITIGFVAKNREVKRIDILKLVENKISKYSNIKIKPIIIDRNYRSNVLNQRQMIEYYKEIDYYLCLSNQEGTPNPALEAAACGNLLISTRVGNMPEIITHNINSFFIDQNTNKIVKKIKEISKIDTKTYNNMSKKLLYEIKLNWSWKKNSKKFGEAMSILINK